MTAALRNVLVIGASRGLRSPLRRLTDVDDVANAVEFLLGDGARSIFRHSANRRCRRDGIAAPRTSHPVKLAGSI